MKPPNNKLLFLISILSLVSYYFLAFHTPRHSFYQLFSLYSFTFLCFWILSNSAFKYKFLFGVVFRLVFFLALPFLSQDYFRFIWDGRLLANGINPYLFTPNLLIENNSLGINSPELLHNSMGELSSNNFSNYPPLNQLVFTIGGLFSPNSILGAVIIFRIFIISADIGIYYFGKKILQSLKFNTNNIHFYFLNPLVIIELTGNLHFEGVMLFLLCLAFYYLFNKKNVHSGVFFGASILLKLLPILILPILWSYFGSFKTFFKYALTVGVITLMGFSFFVDSQLLANYSKTVGLWMSKFEFNASFYYVFREIGFWISGYNQIKFLGKLALLSIVIFNVWFLFKKRKLSQRETIKFMLFGLSFYFFMSTTVHPWYVVSLVFLSIFTEYKFAFFWSFTVFLSYWAYANPNFEENYYFLALEYLPVFGLLFYEVLKSKKLIVSS